MKGSGASGLLHCLIVFSLTRFQPLKEGSCQHRLNLETYHGDAQMFKATAALVFLSLSTVGFANEGPSFNCDANLNAVEKLICESSELASLDRKLADSYKTGLSLEIQPNQLKDGQRTFLKIRNLCEDSSCIAEAYRQRIDEIEGVGKVGPTAEYSRGFGRAELGITLSKRLANDVDLEPYLEVLDSSGSSVGFGLVRSENQLVFTGLDPATSYQIIFRKGFPLDGAVLPKHQVFEDKTPVLKPYLDWKSGENLVILPGGSKPSLQLEVYGSDFLQISIEALLPDVLLRRLQSSALSDGGYISLNEKKVLVDGAKFEISSQQNKPSNLELDLKQFALPESAAYLISANLCRTDRCERYLDQEEMTVVQSNAAISAVSDTDYLTVSVRDYESATLIPQGEVTLYAKNSEKLFEGQVPLNGYVTIPSALLAGDGGQQPALLMHQVDGKESFLSLIESSLSLSQLDAAGAESSSIGDAYLRTERGVYRGGQNVYFSGIARHLGQAPISEQSLVIELVQPDSRVLADLKVNSDLNGLFTGSFLLGEDPKRGRYEAFLKRGATTIGRTEFLVEDFVPETMESEITDFPDSISLGSEIEIATINKYLFGAPAAERPIRSQIKLEPTRKPFAEFRDYYFGAEDSEAFRTEFLGSAELSTDRHGAATFKFPPSSLQSAINSKVPLQLSALVELEELSGRVTRARDRSALVTQKVWLGVQAQGGGKVFAPGSSPEFSLVAVDSETIELQSEKVNWRLVEEDWDYFWYRSGSDWNYRIEYFDRGAVETGQLNIDGETTLELSKLDYGRYRLEVYPEEGSPTEYRLQVGWWANAGASAAIPDVIDTVVSTVNPKAGEEIELTINSPFDGHAEIFVVENQIHEILHATIENRQARISITPPKSSSQLYFLVKAYRQGDPTLPGPSRAVGLSHVTIEPERFNKTVTLTSEDVVRPNSSLELEVQVPEANDGATVIASLVDVGIINLTQHPASKPFDWFMRKKKLSSSLYDNYGFVAKYLPDLRSTGLAVGGDQSSGEQGSKIFFETIAEQSEPVIVRNGIAKIKFDVGQLNGQVRIDVLGSDANASIQQSKFVFVRDKIAVTTTVPRVTAPGDRFSTKLSLTQTEDLQGPVNLEFSSTGPIRLDKKTAQYIPRDVGATEELSIGVEVFGEGDSELVAELIFSDGSVSTYSWNFKSRSPGSYATKSAVIELAPNESSSFENPFEGLFENPGYEIDATRIKTPAILPIARSLAEYRYACLEQTISKSFPFLLMTERETMKAGLDEPQRRLSETYRRLSDLQRPSGRFALWNWSNSTEEWLTIYAVDFLRHEIPADVFEADEFEYLNSLRRAMLASASDSIDSLARNDNGDIKAYALLLKAELGNADVGEMRYLLSQPDSLSRTAAASLGLGFFVLGDLKRSAYAFDIAEKAKPSSLSYSTYESAIRSLALLAAYAAQAQDLERASRIIHDLEEMIRDTRWLSTQERAWLFRGIHKILESQSIDQSLISIDGAFESGQLTVTNNSSERIFVNISASGNLADDSAMFLGEHGAIGSVEKTTSDVELEQRLMIIDELKPSRWIDVDQINDLTLSQGDLLMMMNKVTTTKSANDGEWLLESKAAGGLEPENVLLGGIDPADLFVLVNGIPQEDEYLVRRNMEHNSITLDDRTSAVFELKGEVDKDKKVVWIPMAWRAITPGVFRMPATHVENMLDPRFNAKSKSLRLNVKAP